MIALNVYRASNVWGYQLPCAPVAVCRSISNGDQQLWMKLDYQCYVNEGIQDPENWTQYSNSIIHCSCTINSITLDVGIIASVCSLPNSPSYPQVRAPSLLEKHPRYVPHRDRAGYNRASCEMVWRDKYNRILQNSRYIQQELLGKYGIISTLKTSTFSMPFHRYVLVHVNG